MKPSRRAVLALLALTAGCSTYNPLKMVGIISEPANKPTPLAPIEAKVTPRALWTTSVGKAGNFHLSPAMDGARVYAAAADGTVSVLDEDSGRVVLRADTQKKLSGGVGFGEERLILGTIKGEVIALDSAGKLAWSTVLGGEIIAPAAISRKIAVVRTADGRIFGLSAANGKRLWVFQRPAPALLLRSEAAVLAIGGDVVAGYPNGKLIALDIEDGKLTLGVT